MRECAEASLVWNFKEGQTNAQNGGIGGNVSDWAEGQGELRRGSH